MSEVVSQPWRVVTIAGVGLIGGSFALALRKAGFEVEEVAVRANGARGGARHHIWIAGRATRAHGEANA